MNSSQIELARNRLTQLYTFFKKVEELKAPLVNNVSQYRWLLELANVPSHEKISFKSPVPDDGVWFSVTRPEITSCPKLPDELDGWIEASWESAQTENSTYIVERSIRQGEVFVKERFEQEPKRVELFDRWKKNRDIWRIIELPKRQVVSLWEKLFALFTDLEREGQNWELMLGDGVLSFAKGLNKIYHPIVLKKVELSFDSQTRTFSISSAENPPDFYSSPFAIDEFSMLNIKKWQQSLVQSDFHPLDGDNLDYWLTGLIRELRDGEFSKNIPEENSSNPVLGRSPLLFLRAKSTGRSQYIDEILDHIPNALEFPSSLLGITGLQPPIVFHTDGNGSDGSYANENQEVLLTKPANGEQVEILRRLSKQNSVLVQGPPGTGKTHTIANLIGNFLAEGKSVLVTSHTTKALKVLRGQVAEPLQSLCVSILDSDLSSRKERETAIRELATRLSNNPELYKANAEALKEKRIKLLNEIKSSRRELFQAINSEYLSIIYGGNEHDPTAAAKFIAAGVGVHDWIPGSIEGGAQLPLTDNEVRILYKSNQLINPSEIKELSDVLPLPDDLLDKTVFEHLVNEYESLLGLKTDFRKDLWSSGNQEIDL